MTTTAAGQRPRLGLKDKVIDEARAAAALPQRSFGAHKWGIGGLLIVAGAPGYSGAAALCALAAGRAGAGIINVALPHGLASVVTALVPEAATISLPVGESSSSGRRAAELIEPKLSKSAAMIVGPGLGEDEAADALMSALFGFGGPRGTIGFDAGSRGGNAGSWDGAGGLVARSDKPVLIDADGLNWLAKQERWWERLPAGRAVLTPHIGEMTRLRGASAEKVIAEPVGTVREAAKQWGQVVVLKYGFTAVSDGDRALVAPDAPLSLATGGSGDVFAGTIGAFLAQGVAPMDAAALAIFVGTRAARRVEQRTGVLGLVASDLPPAIAAELATLETGTVAGGMGGASGD